MQHLKLEVLQLIKGITKNVKNTIKNLKKIASHYKLISLSAN